MQDRRERRQAEARKPDCAVCAWRESCETAQDGTFCLRFRMEPPADRGEGPSDRWARGEDADLDG